MSTDSCLFLTSPGQESRPTTLLQGWLPVVVLLGIFCVESTAMLGADHTSGPLHAFTHAISGAQLDSHWSTIHHLIRKTGHFFGYGLFSLAWVRALMLTFRPGERWTMLGAPRLGGSLPMQLAAVAATFSVAGLDELHQSFLPNRTGKFSDVLLDTAGALVLQLALRLAAHAMDFLETRQTGIYTVPAESAAGAIASAAHPLHWGAWQTESTN